MTNGIRATDFSDMASTITINSPLASYSSNPFQNPNFTHDFYHPYPYSPPLTPLNHYTPPPTPPHVYHHIQPPPEPSYYSYTTPEIPSFTPSPMLITDTTKGFLHQLDSKVTQLDEKLAEISKLIKEKKIVASVPNQVQLDVFDGCPEVWEGSSQDQNREVEANEQWEDTRIQIIHVLERMEKRLADLSNPVKKMSSNKVCTFYQKGVCSYGSRCRYEHVKVSRSQPCATSSSAVTLQYSGSFPATNSSRNAASGRTAAEGVNRELLDSSRSFVPATNPAWNEISALPQSLDDTYTRESGTNPAELVMCSFAAAGNCPRGEKCPHIHGDLCPTCGKHCLHPFRLEEREEHSRMCEKRHIHLEALKRSQEIECCVCLERVLSKPTAAERKFGLLSECDHPFCVSCIRNWRSSSPISGMDVNSALRACPICRKLSYFVIPSVIWYSTKEEKQEIVDSYKSKLRSIDCKHFDFGEGSCPFGTSCFYKHAYRDGRLEEVDLRHLGADDGMTVIAKDIRLSDFLNSLRLR